MARVPGAGLNTLSTACPFCGDLKPCPRRTPGSWRFGCFYCRALVEVTFLDAGSQAAARRECETRWNRRTPGPDWACPCCGCEVVTTFEDEASWLGRLDGGKGPATISFARCSSCGLTLAGFMMTMNFWQEIDPRERWRRRAEPGARERRLKEQEDLFRAIELAWVLDTFDRQAKERQEESRAIWAWLDEDPRRQIVIEWESGTMQQPAPGGCIGSIGVSFGIRMVIEIHDQPFPRDQRIITRAAPPDVQERFERAAEADSARQRIWLENH